MVYFLKGWVGNNNINVSMVCSSNFWFGNSSSYIHLVIDILRKEKLVLLLNSEKIHCCSVFYYTIVHEFDVKRHLLSSSASCTPVLQGVLEEMQLTYNVCAHY